MAKKTRVEKEKEMAAESTTPVVETPTPEVGQATPPIEEEEVELIPETLPEPPVAKKEVPVPMPVFNPAADSDMSKEDRILKFIESRRTSDYVKLNDFLKSLYPMPKMNEPTRWLDQGESKRLRILLDNMVSRRQITILNNQHGRLGNFYYEGDNPQTKYHNLNSLTIEARL